MNKRVLFILKYLILFVIGGSIYYAIETVYKGLTSGRHSHWSMFIVGGICFVLIGLINNAISWAMPLWKQMLIGAIIVTVVEFISGYVINIYLQWNVWDYSNLPFNVLGQVCLPFVIVWFAISGVAVIFDDYLRYWIFHEKKPSYRLF